MPVCATCGMEVTEKSAAAKIEYGGQILYFCCGHCKDAFMKNPEKYMAHKHEHGHEHHSHHKQGHGGHSCCK